MLTSIIKSVLVIALLPAPVVFGNSPESQWMIDVVEQTVDFFAYQMEPVKDVIEEDYSTSSSENILYSIGANNGKTDYQSNNQK